MNTARIVDQVRTSRGKRQQAEKALTSIEETTDESKRSRTLLQAVMLQNEAIAALEQALLATAEI
jgi:hypothetical protein